MWQRIASLFARRPVEGAAAPAAPQAPQDTKGEGASPPPAVPAAVPAIEVVKGAAVGLTPRDLARLQGVHPDLVRVVVRARASEAFTVIEGLRTAERQAELVAKGASKTMKSRHLTGHAVDLGPVPLDWQDKPAFRRMAVAMKRAADEEGVPIVWGGSFRDRQGKAWLDGPHFELCRRKYPV